MSSHHRYRSFFWPGLLILAGILALLVNTGTLSVDRLNQLLDLWPLILIVIGLELIVHRSLQGRAGDLAAALIVVLAIGGAVAYVAIAPTPTAGHGLDASAPAGELTRAYLEIDVGAATVTVHSGGSLDGELYRAHIDYSGPRPEISLDRTSGALRISQANSGFTFLQNHRFVMNLELNSGVTWAVTGNSGAATNTLDLGGLSVTSIELNTGASHDEITLGAPTGVVPVTVNGGALTVIVHRPAGVPASVTISGGAVSLDADGRQNHGFGSASFASPDFGSARDAYRIEVAGGACTVTLDTRSSPG